jgi:hypothetical protein
LAGCVGRALARMFSCNILRVAVAIGQSAEQVNISRLWVEDHSMARARTGPVVIGSSMRAYPSPAVFSGRVNPKVVEAVVPIPAPKKIDEPRLFVDAHRVSTTATGVITIGVGTIQAFPDSTWLGRLKEGVEKACVCRKLDDLLGFRPVAIRHKALVEACDERMLDLNARHAKKHLVGGEETTGPKMLKDMAQGGCLSVLPGS